MNAKELKTLVDMQEEIHEGLYQSMKHNLRQMLQTGDMVIDIMKNPCAMALMHISAVADKIDDTIRELVTQED